MNHRRLIIGCGYLGRRLAGSWVAHGDTVFALTRTSEHAEEFRKSGLSPIVGDVTDQVSLAGLPPADTVLYSVGFDRRAGQTPRDVSVGGLENVLQHVPSDVRRLIYISSTSVYGQSDGSLVNEDSATEPREDSGRVVLEAEQLLRAWRPDAIVLRFAGIYGPDRLLRREALLKSSVPFAGPDKWLNLIHVEDGVEATLSAESRGVPGQTYNVVDDEPAPRRDFYTLLAELIGAPPPQFVEQEEPRSANRRVSNAKAKRELVWSPRFTTYREGLRAAV
jgi:nucleoside-diphosphate-sugar epimerase